MSDQPPNDEHDDRPRSPRRDGDDDANERQDGDDRPRRRRDRDDDYDDDRRPRRKSKFPGWAIALVVVGVLGLCAIPVLIGLLLPAVQQVRVAASRISSSNN